MECEVQDKENTTWVCVQALAAIDAKDSAESEKIKDKNGNVTVVCTPSGGAQTVRLQLSPGWMEELSDEELVKKIETNRK
jgi:hypothetical protein